MDYSKLNNIAASIQDVENTASIVENRLNTKIDEDIQSLQDAISDIGNNPSESIDSNVISAALNDLSDKTDNLTKDIENLERVTSSSLNDLNDKVDELNDKVDNNELVTASALADLDDKCIQKDEDGNIIILKEGALDLSNPKHINKKIKIRFIDDIDLFISQYIKILKAHYQEELTPEIENEYIQNILSELELYKVFTIDNDQYQNLVISEIYDSNNNLIEENDLVEFPGVAILPKDSPIVTNTDYYVDDFYVIDENPVNIFELKKSGLLYLFGIDNESSNEESESPKSVQEVIYDLKSDVESLQNLNLDFKNNLKIDDNGNLVVYKFGSYEKTTSESSGFLLSNDYEKIYLALTYDPDSSTSLQLDAYTQQELRQMLIEDNLINPNYYYYVVLDENTGSTYLTDNGLYSSDLGRSTVGFSKFISVKINGTNVEISDYNEKLNNDDAITYIVIGLETEIPNENLSNVSMTFEHYPAYNKYLAKINLYNGDLYLSGIGSYTLHDPHYNVHTVQEVIANLISRIETLENQINGGGNS